MSRDLADLKPDFRATVRTLLANCERRGYELRPYATLRNALDQAKLWRRSRTTLQIDRKIAELEADGAPFLAQVLRDAGPQFGRHVTNAIPGLSWHQWRESLDCFWVVDGEAEWSSRRKVNGFNGYRVYAEEAVRLGLTSGGHWQTLKDWPHVQPRPESSPLKVFTLQEIDTEMKREFG